MNSMPSSTLERIRRYLVGLRMPRALEALDATMKRFEQGDSSMMEVLETLLGEEFTTRETRRIKMALQTARLGTIKTLGGYDFSFQPSLDRDRIMALAQLEFIERRQTVHFLGPPGQGNRIFASRLASRPCAPARASTSARLPKSLPRWPRPNARGISRNVCDSLRETAC